MQQAMNDGWLNGRQASRRIATEVVRAHLSVQRVLAVVGEDEHDVCREVALRLELALAAGDVVIFILCTKGVCTCVQHYLYAVSHLCMYV